MLLALHYEHSRNHLQLSHTLFTLPLPFGCQSHRPNTTLWLLALVTGCFVTLLEFQLPSIFGQLDLFSIVLGRKQHQKCIIVGSEKAEAGKVPQHHQERQSAAKSPCSVNVNANVRSVWSESAQLVILPTIHMCAASTEYIHVFLALHAGKVVLVNRKHQDMLCHMSLLGKPLHKT